MVPASPYETLAFDVQEMLQERLVVRSERPGKTRLVLTKRLEATFHEIVRALDPALVLEVGAHEAAFSAAMAEALPGAEVHAFEAHPGNADRFAATAEAAGVRYHRLAVQEQPGELELQVPLNTAGAERIGMGSLRALPDRNVATYTVEATSLDAFFPSETRPSALWIDVEGAQYEVLAGGRSLLAHCRTAYMEVEATEKWAGQRVFSEIAEMLREVGLRPVLRDVQRRGWQFNVIFVAEDLLGSDTLRAIWRNHFKRVLRATVR